MNEKGARTMTSEQLYRYAVKWRGPQDAICEIAPDGYWTPWHIAQRQIERMQRELVEARTDIERAITNHAADLSADRASAAPAGWRPIESAPIDLEAIKREHAADINFARRGAHALGIRKMDDPPAWEHREKLIAEVERLQEALKRQSSAAISGMNAAKAISSVQLEHAYKLRAESSPEALESERAANAVLTAENEALRAEVTKLERLLSEERAWVYRWHSTLAAESAKLVGLLQAPPLDRDLDKSDTSARLESEGLELDDAMAICEGGK